MRSTIYTTGLPITLYVLLALVALSTPGCRASDGRRAGHETVAENDDTPPFGRVDVKRTPAPAGFPVFSFAGHDQEARLLSSYLWYHFTNRLHLQKALYYQEYLASSDMWMAGADFGPRGKPVQEVFRENLLAMQFDDEGYVHTHQHFSHAHEHGWPFPLWPQGGWNADTMRGVTAGWHFQSEAVKNYWVWMFLSAWDLPEFHGDAAVQAWQLENCKSLGIIDGRWRIEATGPSPTLTTPVDVEIDAFNAPFLQLRWKRTGTPRDHALPYVEWLRADDTEFGPDRRVYLHAHEAKLDEVSGTTHTLIRMHHHPKWEGQIKRMRLSLAPGERDVRFDIDSFFTVYDTRHPINNPIFVLASWEYFRWTGDLDFLRAQLNRMRLALRYQMTEMGGIEHNIILNPWPGHGGLPGWTKDEDGNITMRSGHGIGNNYYDLVPFGWKDCYSTIQYYANLRVMADIEEAVRGNPGWDLPRGALMLDPAKLREHARVVKETGNRLFFNDKTGRYIGSIDKNGQARDYGFTWLSLSAIWYDFATADHAQTVMDWISGRRIVEGDTSTGDDIYKWRFGPRATTLRNIEWYGQCWTAPETIPFGGQIQDGGGVLGFSLYDLGSRLKVLGPDDTWQRLVEIMDWEEEVWQNGGYRPYYADGKQGTTLQGGGTAGGIGVDYEFFESSLLPSIVIYGFLGLDPRTDALRIAPQLPTQCPEMTVRNLLYHNTTIDLRASQDTITVTLKTAPLDAVMIELDGSWVLEGCDSPGSRFALTDAKVYKFRRAD